MYDFEKVNPVRRMNPPFTGDVDTTQMGGIYDVQNMYGEHDPHCGYHIPSVPPLPPTFPSMTEAQQIIDLGHKVNELCGTIEGYNHKVEEAYEAIINSVICNSAYYKEITTEFGYIPESGANYKVIHIPFLDRANQPIFFELGLAYDNTTNAGVKEECFTASKRVDADKLIPAQNLGDSFTGCVMWKGAPIYTQVGDSYTFGVTQSGFFRSYKNATSDILKADKIRNACGARGVLVYNKALATDMFAEDASETKARVAVGQNYDTKERFIIVVDGGIQTGCSSEQLANIFIKYGCMVAIELASATSVYGMDKGSMLFAPAVSSEDDVPSVPASNAFWYITKRRHYHNEYVKDVADLTQTVGEEIWRRLILNEQTDYVKERVVELAKELAQETDERKNADSALDEKYTKEVERLDTECARIESESKQRDDALTELIKTKETESKQRDEALQLAIDNEATARQNNDIQKVAHVDDGDKRTYSVYRNDGTKISENIEVYEYNKLIAQFVTMAQIAENLKTETSERKKADAELQSQLETEIANRTSANTELQAKITKEIADREAEDMAIKALVSAETVARKNGDNELASNIALFKGDYETFKSTTEADLKTKKQQIDTLSADVTNIKTVVDTHTTQMSSINETITALQKTISTMEVSLENMKQSISNLQSAFDGFKKNVESTITKIESNLQVETEARIQGDNELGTKVDDEATTRASEDNAIKALINQETVDRENADAEIESKIDSLGDTYVKKTGDTMTGQLQLTGNIENVNTGLLEIRPSGDSTQRSAIRITPSGSSSLTFLTAIQYDYTLELSTTGFYWSDSKNKYLIRTNTHFSNYVYPAIEVKWGTLRAGLAPRDLVLSECALGVLSDYNKELKKYVTFLKVYSFVESKSPENSDLINVRVAAPLVDDDAVTKKYVDETDALKVNISDEMSDAELATLIALFN